MQIRDQSEEQKKKREHCNAAYLLQESFYQTADMQTCSQTQ